MWFGSSEPRIPRPEDALPGHPTRPFSFPNEHFVLHSPLEGSFPGSAYAQFGMGCFWGAERMFWTIPGVVSTAVGYAGGMSPNPTYEEVCSGRTGHAEIVRVVYDPARVSYDHLLKVFWEGHDPTQGMRQGNDVGTQYRSAVFTYDQAQKDAAERSRWAYQEALKKSGHGTITTEISDAPEFFFAEGYHQQYLAKNPNGYCGHGGTGVSCPIGLPTR
jgi:peptide-methionine (S)-S-oxide reductase